MDIFIEKNILLDEIVILNNFILTYQSTNDINIFIETIDCLRHNTNQNKDVELLNYLLKLINNIYVDVQASQSMIYDKRNLNIGNEILYGLYNSKLLIEKLLNKINNVDSLVGIINEMNI